MPRMAFRTAPVRECVEGIVSRHDRAGVAVAGRPGHFGRSGDPHHRHRFRQLHRRMSQTSSRRSRPAASQPSRAPIDDTGWCPIDPVTFASKLVPDIHVIGDACFGGAIPKSASAANAQGKACAAAVASLIVRQTTGIPRLDGRLLQHGRARLRVLAVRHLSTEGWPVRRGRGCHHKPGRCAARGARA